MRDEGRSMSENQGGGGLKGFYLVFGALALVGLGVVGYAIGTRFSGRAVTTPVALEGSGDVQRLMEMAVPLYRGNPDAPVSIVVFGDYLCSHCATFSLRIRPLVESAFVDTGQARLLFYDFPLNPATGSFLAARAARCAGDQNHFWEYHDLLYRNQLTWGAERDKISILEKYAEDLGLRGEEFRACLNSDRHAQEVSANRELAHVLGIGGTPSVLVGRAGGMSRRLSTYSFESIKEAVEAVLGAGSGEQG